ncbi:MAG TPA: aldehyde dehydrogenase family protein, partial [Terriglobia bacterium]|nr:aldehyde dehydrogenase family protein [Terriglobia bacterium]
MTYRVPVPVNEPINSYAPGTSERKALKDRLSAMSAERIEIPLVIGGKEVRTGDTGTQVMPHKHGHVLATWHKAGPKEVEQAIKAANEARREWGSWNFEDR